MTSAAISNATWVCFDCRQGVRHPTAPRRTVLCPVCRASCFCLGRRIPVPPKGKVAAWRKLRKEVRAMGVQWADIHARAEVVRRHQLEKRIAALEPRPPTPLLREEIERLRRELIGG